MREIKFRAWYHWKHNHDNGWMEYLELGIDDLYQRTFLLSKKLPTLTGLKHFVKLDGFNHECDFELMQYTGLKDKNGKEIYEGDIVKSGNGRLWTIEFGNFVSTIPPRIEVSGYGYYIQPIEKECKEKGNGCLYAGLEVIGNIYENPKLLTPMDKLKGKE